MKVSYFDYPLALEATAEKTLSATKAAFYHLRHLYPDDEIPLFGDSASGGLVVNLAQHLRDEGTLRRPKKLALVSPCLDVSVNDPRSDELEAKDVLLEKDLLM
ncbi:MULTISPECIES: alpha/beta hydrolase fold domain-containing protein [Enterococcus]|uniref:alpha/beta hydrolase fold domain-containing protein n=1 Tax=Enterococcus TaxID=1350 RepID=UPI001CECC56E|nr:alpha/beta hydrolase fold domain-containing protein [Enterococcus avium]